METRMSYICSLEAMVRRDSANGVHGENDKFVIAFCVLPQLFLASCLLFAAYWCWPCGLADFPFARLTLGHLLCVGGSASLVLVGFGLIFKALRDPIL